MTRAALALLAVTTATALTAGAQQAPAAPAPANQAPAARPQAPRGRAPVQVDEERAVRTFFEWHLRPFDARPQPKGLVAR